MPIKIRICQIRRVHWISRIHWTRRIRRIRRVRWIRQISQVRWMHQLYQVHQVYRIRRICVCIHQIRDLKIAKKKDGVNFILLYQSRNMVWQFEKAYLHRPIDVIYFLTPARIQKCFTKFQKSLACLTTIHQSTESRIWQGIFLHVIPVHLSKIRQCRYSHRWAIFSYIYWERLAWAHKSHSIAQPLFSLSLRGRI